MKGMLISLVMVTVYVAGIMFVSQGATPDNPLHKIKRAQEYAVLATKQSQSDKYEYLKKLTIIRFEEVEHVYQTGLFEYVVPANSRYTVAANKLVQNVKQSNDEVLVQDTKDLLQEHKVKLLEHSETFNNVAANAIIFADSANYLDLYLAELE